jgi:broad specificity phosphatase PhoE
MGMPIDLVFVRHGESEGNVAASLSRKGDDSAFTEAFINRHSSTWRLTDRGREQARISGKWIKNNIASYFYRYYVSDYDRAKETASLLDLPEAEWMVTFDLIERNHGDLDVCTSDQRLNVFSENLRKKAMDPFYWTPENGEPMLYVLSRVRNVIETLHRECERQSVILVLHGDVMWGLRYSLERMTHAQIMKFEHSANPHDKIYNGQVIHYTRQDPVTGEIAPYLNWMRSVCPTDLSLSNNDWQPIVRRKFSNEELMREVELRHANLNQEV